MMSDQRERIDKLRQEVMDDVAKRAAKGFADTRFDWLRPLSRRRGLVVLTFGLVSLYGIGMFLDWPFVVLGALIAFMACAALLRVSVRSVTDLPDEIVDERMREVRGLTYRYAFIGAVCVMTLYIVTYIANQLLAKAEVVSRLTAEQMHDASFVMFFTCLVLPTAIYAWMEPEV